MSVVATVNPLSIVFMFITVLICFGVPVGLAIWAKTKYRKAFSLLPLLAGVLGFFISQIIFRLPIVQAVLPLFGWYQELKEMKWLYIVFMCFTAGLVEEPARFIAFSMMKKRRGFTDGLSYGIGHGGIEAILLVGISYIGNAVISLMLNSNTSSLGALLPAAAITELAGTAPYRFLLAGAERIFAMLLHIALSLVVLKGFQTNKRVLYLFISFLLHGTANLAAIAAGTLGSVVISGSPVLGSDIFSEGVLLIVAILSVLYISKQAREWRNMQSAESVANV